MRAKELRNQEAEKLRQTLFDLRSELSKLRATAARGLNQKQVGKIRRARKDVAKVLTVMRREGDSGMNIIGERVFVVKSTDPTKVGRGGEVVLETAKTLVLESAGRKISIEKAGTVLQLESSGRNVASEEIAGRLEDRLRSKQA